MYPCLKERSLSVSKIAFWHLTVPRKGIANPVCLLSFSIPSSLAFPLWIHEHGLYHFLKEKEETMQHISSTGNPITLHEQFKKMHVFLIRF